MKLSLSKDDYEAISLAKIPVDLRKNEPDRFLTKWFDYRPLHPAQATALFVVRYEAAIREAYARYKDRDVAPRIRVLPYRDVFESRDFIAFTSARQAFDEHGIRYEFGLRWILNRYADRGWSFFPRPNQLYSLELVLDLRDAWHTECSASLQIAKLPMYLSKSFVGHPDQIAYRDWLVAQIKQRGNEHWRPLSRLLTEGIISAIEACGYFDSKTVDRALKAAGMSPAITIAA